MMRKTAAATIANLSVCMIWHLHRNSALLRCHLSTKLDSLIQSLARTLIIQNRPDETTLSGREYCRALLSGSRSLCAIQGTRPVSRFPRSVARKSKSTDRLQRKHLNAGGVVIDVVTPEQIGKTIETGCFHRRAATGTSYRQRGRRRAAAFVGFDLRINVQVLFRVDDFSVSE